MTQQKKNILVLSQNCHLYVHAFNIHVCRLRCMLCTFICMQQTCRILSHAHILILAYAHRHAQAYLDRLNTHALLREGVVALWTMCTPRPGFLSVCRVTQTETQPRDTPDTSVFSVTCHPWHKKTPFWQILMTAGLCPDLNSYEWYKVLHVYGSVLLL